MIPKVQAVKRDLRDLTITVIYSDNTTETYMDGYSQLDEIKNGLTKGQVHQIVNLSKTTIKAAPKSMIHYNGDDDDLYRQIYLGNWMDKASGTATATDIAAQTAAATKAAAQARAQTARQMAGAGGKAGGKAGKTSGGNVFVGAAFDPGAFDPLRARVGAAGAYMNSPWATVTMPDFSDGTIDVNLGSAQAHTSAPWDDPLAAQTNDNIVACIDVPEWKPDSKSNNYILPNQIYYHDRFPSISVRALVEDAINILKKEKKLNISIHSLSREGTDWRLVYKTISNNIAPDLKQGKLIECILTSKTFERFSHDLDRYAKLKAKWNTNTYIKMRIAYLLFRALRLNKHDAEAVNLDIFRILGISSHPIFTY